MDTVFDVWKFEMRLCCGMNIKDLYDQLLEIRNFQNISDYAITPHCMAAPHNESLVDGVRLYVKTNSGKIDVTGTVFYWHVTEGSWQKSTTIHSFDTIEECLEWLKNESAACEECANILNERCR